MVIKHEYDPVVIRRQDRDVPMVALDSNMIIDLSHYNQCENKLKNLLRKYNYDASILKNSSVTEKYLGKDFDFEQAQILNLSIISYLYDLIKDCAVQAYITPTVFGELGLLEHKTFKDERAGRIYPSEEINKKYLETSNIIVLQVKDNYKLAFETDVLKLAKEYVNAGAMQREYNYFVQDYVPDKDACIMAEASLFGLFFVTLNTKHFLDLYEMEDGIRTEKIIKVNRNNGLVFTSKNNNNNKIVTCALSLFDFNNMLRKGNTSHLCMVPNIVFNNLSEITPFKTLD